MKLHHDPYRIFRCSSTPMGLYARRKWLGEGESAPWRADFDRTVAVLRAGQGADGSWGRSNLETVRRLFGLHLTVREPDAAVGAGLDSLFAAVEIDASGIRVAAGDLENDPDLRGLPFAGGPGATLLCGAALFLAAIFGRRDHPQVTALYRRLEKSALDGETFRSDRSSFHNVFRAFVVHPRWAACNATVSAAVRLAGIQRASGDWGPGLPFYQTLNALAHLDHPAADRQVEKALPRLAGTQNGDGSFGSREREWNTFLAVHALRNKGRL